MVILVKMSHIEGKEAKRNQPNLNDIKVEVLEFKRKLDPNDFLESLHTIKRAFDYKAISKGKKIKLVTLRLTKYDSL